MGFYKVLNCLSKYLYTTSIFLLCFYTAVAFVNVVARYLFLSSFAWNEEVTTLCFVLGVFLIQIGLELYDKQLSISFITSKIKNGFVLKVLDIFKRLTVVGFLLILVREALPVIKRNYFFNTTTVILKIPMWPLYTVVAIVMFVIVVINVTKMFDLLIFKNNAS